MRWRSCVQQIAGQLLSIDPDLESVPDVAKLLEVCADMGMQHKDLLEAAAMALSSRIEIEG